MREAKKYFVLLVLFVVVVIPAFLLVEADPVHSQSNRASLVADAPTPYAASQGTETAVIVPQFGTWSSSEVEFGDQGGTFSIKFVVSKDNKYVEAFISIVNFSGCGMSFVGETTRIAPAAYIQQSAFSITSNKSLPPEWTLKGIFISPTESEGTFTIKGGDCEVKAEWAAVSETDPATPTPTAAVTMTPTVVAIVAAAIVPEPGHWEGTNPSIAFDITAEGKIHNLTIAVPFSLPIAICNIELAEVVVQSDGMFDWKTKDTIFGDSYDRSISGKFDSITHVTGTAFVVVCENTLSLEFDKWTTNWSAELKTPLQPIPTAAATLTPTVVATTSTAVVGEKVSNGKYELEVTDAKRGVESATMKPKNPSDTLVEVDFSTNYPESICGTLQDTAGHSWKVVAANLNNKFKTTGCIFAVPKTASGLVWHPEGGFPSIALGF